MSPFPSYFDHGNQSYYRVDGNFLISEKNRIPIVDGIPRFVDSKNYASAFGMQWKKFRLTQLDSHIGLPITRQWVKRCMGELYDQLSGKLILEAGCGAGRFTEILLSQKAKVVSVDLSDAVEANKENFPITDSHIIAQADITNLPFEKGQFDAVVCLGVVQHTCSPEETIKALLSNVKKGGYLIFDHYTYSLSYFTKTTALFRFFLKRAKPGVGLRVTESLVKFFFPLHKAVRKIYLAQALLSRISPARSYFHSIPQLSEKDQYEWMLLDTHDSLTDYYKHFRTVTQIQKFLQEIGCENIRCIAAGNGVEAICRKGS